MINIYALINPLNGRVFYVGATSVSLDVRLKQHLRFLTSNKKFKSGTVSERMELVARVISKGKAVKIKLLEKVSYRDADKAEVRWFKYYANKYPLKQLMVGQKFSDVSKPKTPKLYLEGDK